MDRLITVEYVSFTGSHKGDRDTMAFLDGCVGEVDRREYERAIAGPQKRGDSSMEEPTPSSPPTPAPLNTTAAYQHLSTSHLSTSRPPSVPKGKDKGQGPLVSVRFPLIMPASHVGFYPNWGFAPNDVREQGVKIPVRNLRVSKRTPVSRFRVEPFPKTPLDLLGTFENPLCYETSSQERLIGAISQIQNVLPHGWVWYLEKRGGVRENSVPLVFLKARVYGADNLISVYSPNRFKGIAIQIFYRDLISGYHNRMQADVILLTNTPEYVNFVDGVDLAREPMSGDPHSYFKKFYRGKEMVGAKEAISLLAKRNKERQAKAQEPKKEAPPPNVDYGRPGAGLYGKITMSSTTTTSMQFVTTSNTSAK